MSDFDPTKPGDSTAPQVIEWAKTASDEDKAAALAAEKADKNRSTVLLALGEGEAPPAPETPDTTSEGAPEGRSYPKVDFSSLREGQPADMDVYLILDADSKGVLYADGGRHLATEIQPGDRANHVVMKGAEVYRGVIEQLRAIQPAK